jgi:hypothetical protein
VARDAQREPLEAPAQATRESAQPPQPSAAIEARIAALEKAIAQLQSDLRAAREPRPAAAPASTDDIRSAQRVTNDFGATDQERVQALGKLRGSQIDGKPAITEDVLRSMVDLAERSPDESVRHDVYRNLHNSPSPLVRDSMLRALAGDPSAKVRKRAAQDIDTYLAEAIVVTALQNAAANDADESVRAQAKKTLAKDR